MKHLQELMANAAKQEELALRLPELKDRLAEWKEGVSDRKNEMDWARLTAKNLEDPGFFQRLLGGVEKKQEQARMEARQAAAAYEEVKRELEHTEHQLTRWQAEYETLSGSREAYDYARKEFLAAADAEAVQRLREMEMEAFRPVAIEAVRRIRKALHEARGWMGKDIQNRYYSRKTRRMEFLQLADAYAEKLQSLLAYFPEGSINLGASMSAPGDYIRSVSTNLSQVDLLNIAVEQSLRVQGELEAL